MDPPPDRSFGVVFLGASQFPYKPGLDKPAFAMSKQRVAEVLTEEYLLGARIEHLDLFDLELTAADVVNHVSDFVQSFKGLTDLIIYYCGHGGFLPDRTYYLILRSTRQGREATTGLLFRPFRLDLEDILRGKRIYLVLDCCYAASAVSDWMADVSISTVIAEHIESTFPSTGIALLVAASRTSPAVAPDGEETTLFSGHLSNAIRNGVLIDREQLSLVDLAESIRSRIRGETLARQVWPELHVPRQDKGDVSLLPFIRNVAHPVPNGGEISTLGIAAIDEGKNKGEERIAAQTLSKGTLLIAGVLGVGVLSAIGVWAMATAPTRNAIGSLEFVSTFVPLPLERELALKPNDRFKECDACAEMVVVPAGTFTMGSATNETIGRNSDTDRPPHPVTLATPFAVGVFSVTFDEWDACVVDGGCNGYRPVDQDWGRGRQPVINVSWDDAKAYLAWLSRKTGKSYRLLSETEREYVTRAGTSTPFWWGPSISTSQANYNGYYTYGGGSKGEYREKTVPVASFQPNPWGLYQVHGNVWEWTQDCYHNDYAGAPTDGSAWTSSDDCRSRMVRGGSWKAFPRELRAANRYFHSTNYRSKEVGFRVARTLGPP